MTLSQKLQAHGDDPHIGAGLRDHQQAHFGLGLTEESHRQVAAEGDQDGRYHPGHVVVAGVAGDGVQDDDADAGKGKHRVAQDGQGGVALIGTPVILRQQADQDAQDGRQPDQDFHSYGSLKLREGGLPDIQQDDIEYRHGDGRDLQPDAELLFDPVAAASHGPDDPGHQMEGVTAAEGQSQDTI